MEKKNRVLFFTLFIVLSALSFYIFGFVIFSPDWLLIITDFIFWILIIFYFLTINEIINWIKEGKRSELADLVVLAFLFFLIFFLFKDILIAIIGAFFIYLLLGRSEVKEYEIISKLLDISLVTYAVLFISGVTSRLLENELIFNIAFSFSFWLILILGFAFFGRKYLIVFRFISPEYLTLLLYILAWLAVVFINQYTPLDFLSYIYIVLIITNWIVYFLSGPILDKMLGIKRVQDENLINLVNELKEKVGIKGKIKVGFGKYPILNAMAYGSFFDKRIAIIAEDVSQIAEDEIDGIIAHELAHTRGYHTLILTLITSIDLFIRMLVNFPATYYDYVFGNPSIPLFAFILINIGIFIVLYFFVRILEGRADLKTKRIGLGPNLAKALYNLESFYAHGRDVGLNTMLLCDEKITKNNQMLDYKSTAEYINNSMIKPSRGSLLGNFLNSHPPTYLRIAAILGDDLKPRTEAFLTFTLMKRSKQRKFASLYSNAREVFKKISSNKFKEKFDVQSISKLMVDLKKSELYQRYVNKTYIFSNKIDKTKTLGKVVDISFLDDACESVELNIEYIDGKENGNIILPLYNAVEYEIGSKYLLKEKYLLTLEKIELFNDNTEGNYIFSSKMEPVIKKSLKFKIPKSMGVIENLKDKDVFLTTKGSLAIVKCTDIEPSNIYNDYRISILENGETSVYSLKDLIIKTSDNGIGLVFFRDLGTKPYEIKLLEWLKEKQLRTSIFLKKPVNNEEIGYIQEINVKYENQLALEKSTVKIKNIFGEDVEIPFKKIEVVLFDYDSVTILRKDKTSAFSKFGYKILKRFSPQKIFI